MLGDPATDPRHAPGAIADAVSRREALPHMGIPIPEHGTRDNVAPRPGARKIVCLGCSHTYGYTAERFTWPALLERLINRAEYQALNMARRNYGLRLNIDWYAEFGRRLRPERCIIQVPLFCRQPLPGFQDDIPSNYTMKDGSINVLLARRVSLPEYLRMSRGLIEADVARLSDFISALKTEGVTPAVVLYKTAHDLYEFLWDLVVEHHAKIVALCGRLGVACCAGERLSNRAFCPRGMLWNATHPNERGNLFIAQSVYRTAFCPPLRRHPLLRIARLGFQCRRSILARKAEQARSAGGAQPPPAEQENDLPGEIYTLW